jgi:hypothetical protein
MKVTCKGDTKTMNMVDKLSIQHMSFWQIFKIQIQHSGSGGERIINSKTAWAA